MKKWIVPLLLGLLYVSCGEEGTLTPKHTPKHEVEITVLKFVNDVKNDVYADHIYFFEADTEFTREDKKYYFRRLEKFLRNNHWDLYFTAVDIYEGDEYLADVILKAKSGDLVVFSLGYWLDTKRWELDAYEFPGLTYYRPSHQSYEDYVKQLIKKKKEVGVEYSEKEMIGTQGMYYIEYQ